MRLQAGEPPVTLDVGESNARTADWGGMAVSFATLAGGTDFSPAFQGLKDDMCQVPHWAYVLRGALNLRTKNGREENISAGDVWYAPPGHTAWVDEDTEVVEFTPKEESDKLMDHIKRRMGL